MTVTTAVASSSTSSSSTANSSITTYALLTNSTTVQPGQAADVTWTSPGGSAKDWIGWFRTGDSNSAYDPSRWRYTGGASSGSFTITAPTTPGTYEFRYLLNDGYSDVARSNAVTVAVSTSAPTVSLSASLSSINPGQSSRLSWSSTNATSCSASGGWSGNKALSGSEDVFPNVSMTFTLSCSGPGGSASQSADVSVATSTGPAYYVSSGVGAGAQTAGNDANPGTAAQPFKTLRKAISVLGPGVTLFVRGGEYDTVNGLIDGSGNSVIPSGSSWNSPVTIKAYSGEKPVFRRYVPAGNPYTETQIQSGGHMPTYNECLAKLGPSGVTNFPWNCWVGGTEPNGMQEVFTYGNVSGYVMAMDNDDSNPVQYIIFDGINFDSKGITQGLHFYTGAKHIRFQNGEIAYSIQSCVAQQASNVSVETDLQFINVKIHHCGVPYDTNLINGIPARKHPAARFRHPWYMHAGGNLCDGCETYESAGTGIGPDGKNNIIKNSYIHDNNAQCMIILGSGWQVYNNICYNNAGGGLKVHGVWDALIANNTIINGAPGTTANTPYGIFITSAGALLSAHLENNIVWGFSYGFWNEGTQFQGPTVRNNLVFGANPGRSYYNAYSGVAPMQLSNNLSDKDPKFVNPGAQDFRLQGGSPGINAGVDNGIAADIAGTPRPQGAGYDIGAYEYR